MPRFSRRARNLPDLLRVVAHSHSLERANRQMRIFNPFFAIWNIEKIAGGTPSSSSLLCVRSDKRQSKLFEHEISLSFPSLVV
jgi:hypothetical protein